MVRDGDVLSTPPETLPAAPHAHKGFTSYSLNFEDVILHRIFAGRERGFYVDVGAGHPRFENDTCALHEKGWTGINVEPNEAFIEAFRKARPGDRNLCLALSDVEGELLYHEIPGTGLSTCDREQAAVHAARGHEIRARNVPVSTLARVLDEAGALAVDLLKVDVEGLEGQVLAGNDWTRFRPRVVLVEATFPERPERRPTGVRQFLEERGYHHTLFDGLNDFYVEQDFETHGAFTLPPNVFDGFVLREVADLHSEVAALRDQFRSAQTYAASLEEERKALQTQVRALEEALAAAQVRGAQAAALEAALAALLRGRRSSTLRFLAADGTPAPMTSASKGRIMGVAQGSTDARAGEEAAIDATIAGRLAVAQMEGLQAENRRLGLDLDDVREENRRLRNAAEQMRAEILVLSRALEPMHRLNEELASWRPQMLALSEEVVTWRTQSMAPGSDRTAEEERLRDSEQQHRARAEQLAAHVQAIHASSSWRLTRPLRVLGRRLRGRHGGDGPAS